MRYADDFLITGTSKALLRDQVQPLVAHFLKQRGLELSHEKTWITHVEEGFDFLGQNVRRYRYGKVLTKPSSDNVKTFLSKIRETIDNSGSLTAGVMIQRLNQPDPNGLQVLKKCRVSVRRHFCHPTSFHGRGCENGRSTEDPASES